MYKGTYNHSALNSKEGSSEILLKRAFPPEMASKDNEIESFEIYPSWSVYLFLFPGFKITTLSYPLYLKTSPHFFYTSALIHMNLNLAPLSIFLSNLTFRASKMAFTCSEGFLFVMKITQRVLYVPKQISLALL